MPAVVLEEARAPPAVKGAALGLLWLPTSDGGFQTNLRVLRRALLAADDGSEPGRALKAIDRTRSKRGDLWRPQVNPLGIWDVGGI